MTNKIADPSDANIMRAFLTGDSEVTQLELDLWLKPAAVKSQTCGSDANCPITQAVMEVEYIDDTGKGRAPTACGTIRC